MAQHEGSRYEDEDDVAERYDRALAAIVALPELGMRVACAGRHLSELEADDVVWWLGQMLRGALWGRRSAMDAMLATSLWLLRTPVEEIYDWCQSVFIAAHTQQRPEIMYLLRDAEPPRQLGEGARLPEVRLLIERDVSLGERRSLARSARGDMLDRLLQDPSPLVLERLLDNPKLRPSSVLSVASRRPTTVELLDVVARHRTWLSHHDVREALVMNPFVRTGVALKLLPTLHYEIMLRLRNASDVHPAVSDLAQVLVELRGQRIPSGRS